MLLFLGETRVEQKAFFVVRGAPLAVIEMFLLLWPWSLGDWRCCSSLKLIEPWGLSIGKMLSILEFVLLAGVNWMESRGETFVGALFDN